MCQRIWPDLDEYCNIFSEVLAKETNKLLINQKNGCQEIIIIVDYWITCQNGRYLYEQGDYVINFLVMKNLML